MIIFVQKPKLIFYQRLYDELYGYGYKSMNSID